MRSATVQPSHEPRIKRSTTTTFIIAFIITLTVALTVTLTTILTIELTIILTIVISIALTFHEQKTKCKQKGAEGSAKIGCKGKKKKRKNQRFFQIISVKY
jgi:uncharacterized membrane protein